MEFSNYDDKIVQDEINAFIKQPYEFIEFIDFKDLIDNEISLHCYRTSPEDVTRNWVPSYFFAIMLLDKQIGYIDIRIGYTEGLYYGGNIGYSIDEDYRGRGFALRACKLISNVARAHKMRAINISNEYSNHSSKRVCEKLGAKFLRTVRLPLDNDMRKEGHEYENIFVWEIN